MGGGANALVSFGPQNPSGAAWTGAPIPSRVAIRVIDCFADPVAGLVGEGCRQACPDLPGGGDPAFCLDGGHWGHDIAVLILAERIDGSAASVYPAVPAGLVEEDPGCSNFWCSPWTGTNATLVGYGIRGLPGLDGSHDQLRQWAGVGITGCVGAGTTCLFLNGVGRPGDSGGPVYLRHFDEIPDNTPRGLIGVFGYGGDQFVRVSHPDIRAFLEHYVGSVSAHFPGAMVQVDGRGHERTGPPAPSFGVWTGGLDLPPRSDPAGRARWANDHRCALGRQCNDPELRFAPFATRCELCGEPDRLDPDGDGLVLSHDNCWGVYNPRQRDGDASDPGGTISDTAFDFAVADALGPRTGASALQGGSCLARGVTSWRCLPRVAGPDGAEPSIDGDHDRFPDPCDLCPTVYDPGQRLDCVGEPEACAPDDDHDGFTNACDTCPVDSTTSTRDCNFDAELAVQASQAGALPRACSGDGECAADEVCARGVCAARSCTSDTECVAPHVCDQRVCRVAPRADVCDATPCGDTTLGSARQTLREGGTRRDVLALDRVLVDATRGRASPIEPFHSGFRFCPCSAGVSDAFGVATACAVDLGDGTGLCTIPVSALQTGRVYAAAEGAPYFRATLSGDPRLDAPSEVTLTHAYDPAIDLSARWDVVTDRARWRAIAPGSFPPGVTGPAVPGGTPSTLGMVWTQTLRHGSSGPELGEELPLAAHFHGGPVGGTTPVVSRTTRDLFLPMPGLENLCAHCGTRLPIPWVGFPCPPAPDRPCAGSGPTTPSFVFGDVAIAPSVSEAIAPSSMLFGGLAGARWMAAPESASRTAGGLRFVALAADGGLPLRLLGGTTAELALFGKLTCNKGGCFEVSLPPGSALAPTPDLASAKPASRTDFAMALSALESTFWIAGGRDQDGGELHDVIATSAIDGSSEALPTAPLELGRVQALAYHPADRRLYAIDEVSERGRWITRLVSIGPDWSGGREEARWLADRGSDEDDPRGRGRPPSTTFALSGDERGHLWIAASRGGNAHTVLRLSPRTPVVGREREDRCRRGPRGESSSWVLDGVVTRPGRVTRDGAYANELGLSLAISVGTDARVVGYAASDLRGRGGREIWL